MATAQLFGQIVNEHIKSLSATAPVATTIEVGDLVHVAGADDMGVVEGLPRVR